LDCALLLEEDLLSPGSLVYRKQDLFHLYRSHPEAAYSVLPPKPAVARMQVRRRVSHLL
jgi:hypothetical protein